MTDDITILSVEDHGIWRRHRSWTVRVDGPKGRAQVSVIDVETKDDAILQAVETYTNMRVFSEEEKAAFQAANEALRKNFGR